MTKYQEVNTNSLCLVVGVLENFFEYAIVGDSACAGFEPENLIEV